MFHVHFLHYITISFLWIVRILLEWGGEGLGVGGICVERVGAWRGGRGFGCKGVLAKTGLPLVWGEGGQLVRARQAC